MISARDTAYGDVALQGSTPTRATGTPCGGERPPREDKSGQGRKLCVVGYDVSPSRRDGIQPTPAFTASFSSPKYPSSPSITSSAG